jgi:tetratricopeptide (TPR) repeat protein
MTPTSRSGRQVPCGGGPDRTSRNFSGHALQPKQIIFRILPSLLFVLLLILTESGLRLFSPSLRNPLVLDENSEGMEFYGINRRFLRKYFPTTAAEALPELKPSLFRKFKGRKVTRIMCLGESTMFGIPYQLSSTIPTIVQKQLRHIFPDREFEVINVAASAVNSNVVRDISLELVDYEADIVLLYLGHNEFYGPDGVGAGFLERHFPSLIQMKYRLNNLRLLSLLQKVFGRRPNNDVERERNLMREVSQEQHVRLDSEASSRIFRLFERNLGAIIHTFREKHIPVIVSDVTSNLVFPPFASDTLAGEKSWEEIRGMVELQYSAGRYEELAAVLDTLLARDTSNAFLQYWFGRTLMQLGEYEMARRHLLAAKDNDLLKFRAPEETNAIIRRVCVEAGASFISSDSLFSSLSPHKIQSDNLFWEHLHPTSQGYYAIADLFVERILDLKLIDGPLSEYAAGRLLPYDRDSLSICWLDVAYADLAIRALTRHWPFHDYDRAPVIIQSEDSALVQVAKNVFLNGITWNQGCYMSALRLGQLGRFREAKTTYEALLEDTPFDYYVHYALGNLLKDQGLFPQAALQFRLSIKFNPDYPYSRVILGLVEVETGNFDSAIEDLTNALPLMTGRNLPALEAFADYGLAAAYYNRGDRAKASFFVHKSLALNSNSSASRALAEKLGEMK